MVAGEEDFKVALFESGLLLWDNTRMLEHDDGFPKTFQVARDLLRGNPDKFQVVNNDSRNIAAYSKTDTSRGRALIILDVHEGGNDDEGYVHANAEIHEDTDIGTRPAWGYRHQVSTQRPGELTVNGLFGRFKAIRDVFGTIYYSTDAFAETKIPEVEARELLENSRGHLRHPEFKIPNNEVDEGRKIRMKQLFDLFFE